MEKIFEDRIIVIDPRVEKNWQLWEEYDEYNYYLYIPLGRLMPFFQQFGNHSKRIHIQPDDIESSQCQEIFEKIIKTHAHQLTEFGFEGIWESMPNDFDGIIFPGVKKFSFIGASRRNSLNLHSMFPNLKSLKFEAHVSDTNCLANVMNLNELELKTFLEFHHLQRMFRNNPNLSKLSLFYDPLLQYQFETRIFDLIKGNLKHLKSLTILGLQKKDIIRSSRWAYNLTSVTSFRFNYLESSFPRDLSFDMPNLEKLTFELKLKEMDTIPDHFINRFTKLKSLELRSIPSIGGMEFRRKILECMKKLTRVQEISIDSVSFNGFKTDDAVYNMKSFFVEFDKTDSNLNRIKLLKFNGRNFTKYEEAMAEINEELKTSGRPTWTVTRGEDEKTHRQYLLLKRN